MRNHWFIAAFTAVILLGSAHKTDAGMIGMPIQLKSVMQHISFDTPASSQFCERDASEFPLGPVNFEALRATEEIQDQVAALNVGIAD